MLGLFNPLDLTAGAEGLATQEQLTAQQKVARAMMERARKSRPMTHWSQALNQAVEGALGGLAMRDAAASAAKTAEWNANALTGDLSAPGVAKVASAISGAPAASSAPSGAFPASLISTESGGNWGASNNVTGAGGAKGHFGRLQFGQARLAEAAAAGAIPRGTTPQQFMASPEIQKAAERWHFADIDEKIRANGLDKAIGTNINGVPVTMDGMRAVAHLGGTGGLKKFIESGGRYNPADANGTSLTAYLKRHGGNTQVAADMPAPSARPVEMPGNTEGFVIPGPYREGQPVVEPLQAPIDRGTSLTPQEALQPASQPVAAAPAPMTGETFNAVTAGAPLEPVFQSEGVAQPWMGTAIAPPPAQPAPVVAQAAPMPPPRPADLASTTPQADLPAPGAKPAMLQLPVSPVTGMPDLSNENGAGARELMVAEALMRQGQPSPFMAPAAAPAAAPMAAPAAPQTAVERVAAAIPPDAATAAPAAAQPASPGAQGVAAALGVNPRVLAAATSPYASEGTRKIAQTIIDKQMRDAEYNRPDAAETRRLEIEGKGLGNEKTRRELMGEGATPLTAEERTAYGIGPNQSAYKTRNGEIKFGPAGTTINNNMDMKAEGAEASARGAGLGKRLNEIADEGAKAGEDTVLFQRLGDILSTVKTGKTTETLEKIRQATGIALDPNTDNVQALGALIQYIGPRLRVPGSGAQSDRELSNFLNSIVSLAGTPEGNQKILTTLNGFVEHKRQRAAIASEWQLGEISAKDAQKRIDSLPSPFAKREEAPKAVTPGAAPDRASLEAEARRRGLIK